MTFKFCKSALSLLLFAHCSSDLSAQATPKPAATPAEKKSKEGYLRFWNVLPAEWGQLALIQDNGSDGGIPLLTATPMNYYASYLPTRPGRYALKVVRLAEPKTALKTFDVALNNNVFVTFLARMVDGKPNVEMLDDTYDLAKAETGRMVIRQFVPNATITMSTATAPATPPLAQGEERVLENLPLRSTLFRMQARMPDGKLRSWSVEVDFKSCRHASLWLMQDPHGRFRPRLSADGQIDVDTPEK